jgi:hypothetical protein
MVEDGLNYWNCYKGFNFLQPANIREYQVRKCPLFYPIQNSDALHWKGHTTLLSRPDLA